MRRQWDFSVLVCQLFYRWEHFHFLYGFSQTRLFNSCKSYQPVISHVRVSFPLQRGGGNDFPMIERFTYLNSYLYLSIFNAKDCIIIICYCQQICLINDRTKVTLAFDEDQHHPSCKIVVSLITAIYSYHIFQVKNGSHSHRVKERPVYKRLKNYD